MLNSIISITARVTKSAELFEAKGKQGLRFSIVDKMSFKKNGEYQSRVTFIDCTLWNRPNSASLLRKGAVIKFEGHLRADQYPSKEGVLKPVIRFTVDNFDVIDFARDGGQSVAAATNAAPVPAGADAGNDDLPF